MSTVICLWDWILQDQEWAKRRYGSVRAVEAYQKGQEGLLNRCSVRRWRCNKGCILLKSVVIY